MHQHHYTHLRARYERVKSRPPGGHPRAEPDERPIRVRRRIQLAARARDRREHREDDLGRVLEVARGCAHQRRVCVQVKG